MQIKNGEKTIKKQNYFAMNAFALAFESAVIDEKNVLNKLLQCKRWHLPLWVCSEHYWGMPFNSRLSKYSPLYRPLHIYDSVQSIINSLHRCLSFTSGR